MMIWKTMALLGLALCAQSRHATSELVIKQLVHHGHHGELEHIGPHDPQHHEGYASAYPKYEFSYSVNDPHTHDQKGHQESRDGDEVKGAYWLVQPDGKKRTVTYHADKHTGFKAHVSYTYHHHPVEEVIIPVVDSNAEEPYKEIDLIHKVENLELKHVEEEKDEREEDEDKKEENHEERDKPIHRKLVHIEHYEKVIHPVYKKHEPVHHVVPEVHEDHVEDDREEYQPKQRHDVYQPGVIKPLVRNDYRSDHEIYHPTPLMRYTKIGKSDHVGVNPYRVNAFGLERRHHVDRPYPTTHHQHHSRYYRDSKQRHVCHIQSLGRPEDGCWRKRNTR